MTASPTTNERVTGQPTSSRPSSILGVDGLCVVYSGVAQAVNNLSFRVGQGEVVALLGPNGAGKTTTLRALTGFLPGDRVHVSGGSAMFAGQEMLRRAPHQTLRMGLALVGERDKIFSSLTIEENLALSAGANGNKDDVGRTRELIDELFPVLGHRRNKRAGYLSGGERQMLAIASALLTGPRVLMMDELSLGLAPKIVGELIEVLRRLNREQGLTILLVEQSALVAFAIGDYVHVLNLGRSVLEGRPDQLKNHPDFQSSYLGLGRRKEANRA